MFRKISILFLFLVFVVIGFVAITLEQRMNKKTIDTHSEAESYCLWKGGELSVIDTMGYCNIHGKSESVESFFNRLGE